MRPRLPTFDRLETYLRRIDENRTYSNRGPLVFEFEDRFERHFGLSGNVVTASSGTAALVAAILATAGRATAARPLAMIPAYTFVATALAAEMCGFEPYVLDVSPENWMLSPRAVREHPALGRTGVVICVAPYGRAFECAAWQALREETGVAVVFDAAASFDVLARAPVRAKAAFGALPVALSLHATKSFSTGEGGAVVTTDPALLGSIAQSLNLGFAGTRDCKVPALNGKLSEYHAAVGLAEFDGWDRKHADASRVADAYGAAAARNGLAGRIVASPEISSCYVLVDCRTPERAQRVATVLSRAAIGSRFWYGTGIAGHAHFGDAPRDALPVTQDVAGRLLGLPTAPDLATVEIEEVVATVATVLNQ